MNLKTTVLLVDDRPPRLKDGLHKHNQTISDLLSIEGFHIADSKECESIFKELKNEKSCHWRIWTSWQRDHEIST